MREASPATSSAVAVDRDRLTDCEKVIAAGMATFVDVGTALAEIRDTRLYLATHKTFEAYCRERWGMDRTYAHRTIEAAEVTKRLLSMGNTPTNERQVRPLTALPAEQQVTAWKAATAKAAAEDRPVPAKDVRAAVTAMRRERVIASGMRTFVDVGTALAEIRDSRLYRATHATFEAYCRGRWGMAKTHANRLVGAAQVVALLAPIGVTPATESQARPLTRLEPPPQVEAWEAATDKAAAEDRPVTTKDVRAAVTAMRRELGCPLFVRIGCGRNRDAARTGVRIAGGRVADVRRRPVRKRALRPA